MSHPQGSARARSLGRTYNQTKPNQNLIMKLTLFVFVASLYAQIDSSAPQSFSNATSDTENSGKSDIDVSKVVNSTSTDLAPVTSNAFKPVVVFWIGTGIIAIGL
jgi:hypothetical protein